MYTSNRAQQLRNGLVAITNGSITLIILLIAPLGLAAVIINTLLVTVSSYVISSVADRIIIWLLPYRAEMLSNANHKAVSIQRISRNFLNQRKRN